MSGAPLAEIVNLRLARKRKARAQAAETAAQNRAAHGRTKAHKLHERLESERERRTMDGHLLDAQSEEETAR